jgi:4-hydroxy-4-methyl-2-oxoglutarate aldolase
MLPEDVLLKLRRWNTPSVYNGWEQITGRSRLTGFNMEELTDFMPESGPIAGYAVTVKIKPSEAPADKELWSKYRNYIASIPGPKIIVMQDLDKPITFGSFWGEVTANTHRSLGCVGTIVDGAIRDLDEMKSTGFKALARRLCVGHAFAAPLAWGEPVEVFGTTVRTGDLIHADKHGFLIIPEEDQERILEAVIFMDNNECETVIGAAMALDKTDEHKIIAADIDQAAARFSEKARKHSGRKGEWS